MRNSNLIQALIVTAEVTGTDISEGAARVMLQDLSHYTEDQMLSALLRCRRECKGRLTLADIISRINDGRPAPETAWAMVAPCLDNEDYSVVWTREMATAYGVAYRLADDRVAARMGFRESYVAACAAARDKGESVRWEPSLGHDPSGRAACLIEAQKLGRLSQGQVEGLLAGCSDAGEWPNGLPEPTATRMLANGG